MIDKEKVKSIVEEWLKDKEYFLVDVEINSENKIVVEIDHTDGVWIEDCVELSRFIEDRLDRDAEDFELEVGSAGLGQPFKVVQQYMNHIGKEVEVLDADGKKYKGAAYMRKLDQMIRDARGKQADGRTSAEAASIMWYLWLSEDSPLFGKDKMTTFERYFIADKSTHKENKIPYYKLIDNEEIAVKILKDFGLDPKHGFILNGHVPVKLSKGETPIKANGKLFIIDGGISKAYHKTTGIAGYTAIMTSKHMYIAEHQPYEPLREDGTQVFHRPIMHLVHTEPVRLRIRDTDNGAEIREQIATLEALYDQFVGGGIREIY